MDQPATPPLKKKPTMVGLPILEYALTDTKHIFRHTTKGLYYFADETEGLNGPYATEELAAQGLRDYIAFSLDGPDKLKDVENMVDQLTDIRDQAYIVAAKRYFEQCRGEDALLTLRRYADQLRPHNERLYHLVMNKPT